jgi:chromate transporter
MTVAQEADEPGPATESLPIQHGKASIYDLALLFLRLGATAFGGPAAHIALIEHEVVRRKHWLTREEFLDLLGATNLIPGPNSTEMAIHIGWKRARWVGLTVAGLAFILPAALIVLAVAWAYVRYGSRPEVVHLLYGVKPVIIAIIVQAIWRLGSKALCRVELGLIAVLGIVLNAAGLNELLVLFGGGVLAVLFHMSSHSQRSTREPTVPCVLTIAPLGATAAGLTTGAAVPVGLAPLFLFFLKVGSVLFGSGYVLIAFLRTDLVQRWGWLSDTQLLDAITVGQITPGPVFTTATFIGYVLAGIPGATLATIGIFLPAFAFVAISGPLVPRLRRSALAGAFLDGVNATSVSLMTVVTWRLGQAALVDGLAIFLAVLSIVALLRLPVNSLWLLLAGGMVGWVSKSS